MKPKWKFNNGIGATLCNKCNTIISSGHTQDLFCDACKTNMWYMESLKVELRQKPDDMDDVNSFDEDQVLTIGTANSGAGNYFYISTTRWAVDNFKDLKELFTKFEKTYKRLKNENTDL